LFSDVLKALDWLKSAAAGEELADVPTVAAVNISLGSETDFASTSAECDAFSNATSFKTILQGLKTMKIATTIATGNSGADTSVAGKISFPSCLSSDAVAVAATNNTGTSIASYTNNGTLTTLLAPGDAALPTVGDDNSSYVYRSGTSYAAPIVAGAYAVLREKYPNSDIDTLTTHLESTGKLITDSRSGYGGVQKPLIQLASALTKNINNDQDELPNTDVPTDDDDDTGVIITPTPTPETPTTGFFTTDDGQIRVSTILASLACLVSGLFLLRFMVKKATKKSVSLIKRW
jgi:subtilisin family serine protease